MHNSFLIWHQPIGFEETLTQFQVVTYDKEDMRKLVKVIAKSNNANQSSSEKIDKLFDYTWYGLKQSFDKVDTKPETTDSSLPKPISSQSTLKPVKSVDRLEKTEESILLFIALKGIDDDYALQEFVDELNLPESKVEYFLDRLVEMKWLKQSGRAEYPWRLNNKKATMDYLVKYDLI